MAKLLNIPPPIFDDENKGVDTMVTENPDKAQRVVPLRNKRVPPPPVFDEPKQLSAEDQERMDELGQRIRTSLAGTSMASDVTGNAAKNDMSSVWQGIINQRPKDFKTPVRGEMLQVPDVVVTPNNGIIKAPQAESMQDTTRNVRGEQYIPGQTAEYLLNSPLFAGALTGPGRGLHEAGKTYAETIKETTKEFRRNNIAKALLNAATGATATVAKGGMAAASAVDPNLIMLNEILGIAGETVPGLNENVIAPAMAPVQTILKPESFAGRNAAEILDVLLPLVAAHAGGVKRGLFDRIRGNESVRSTNVPPKIEPSLPEFKSSDEAILWGKEHPEAIDALEKRAQKSDAITKQFMAEKNYDEGFKIGFKAQLDREALSQARNPQKKTVMDEVQETINRGLMDSPPAKKPIEEIQSIEESKDVFGGLLDELATERQEKLKEFEKKVDANEATAARMRMEGKSEPEIAEALGVKPPVEVKNKVVRNKPEKYSQIDENDYPVLSQTERITPDWILDGDKVVMKEEFQGIDKSLLDMSKKPTAEELQKSGGATFGNIDEQASVLGFENAENFRQELLNEQERFSKHGYISKQKISDIAAELRDEPNMERAEKILSELPLSVQKKVQAAMIDISKSQSAAEIRGHVNDLKDQHGQKSFVDSFNSQPEEVRKIYLKDTNSKEVKASSLKVGDKITIYGEEFTVKEGDFLEPIKLKDGIEFGLEPDDKIPVQEKKTTEKPLPPRLFDDEGRLLSESGEIVKAGASGGGQFPWQRNKILEYETGLEPLQKQQVSNKLQKVKGEVKDFKTMNLDELQKEYAAIKTQRNKARTVRYFQLAREIERRQNIPDSWQPDKEAIAEKSAENVDYNAPPIEQLKVFAKGFDNAKDFSEATVRRILPRQLRKILDEQYGKVEDTINGDNERLTKLYNEVNSKKMGSGALLNVGLGAAAAATGGTDEERAKRFLYGALGGMVLAGVMGRYSETLKRLKASEGGKIIEPIVGNVLKDVEMRIKSGDVTRTDASKTLLEEIAKGLKRNETFANLPVADRIKAIESLKDIQSSLISEAKVNIPSHVTDNLGDMAKSTAFGQFNKTKWKMRLNETLRENFMPLVEEAATAARQMVEEGKLSREDVGSFTKSKIESLLLKDFKFKNLSGEKQLQAFNELADMTGELRTDVLTQITRGLNEEAKVRMSKLESKVDATGKIGYDAEAMMRNEIRKMMHDDPRFKDLKQDQRDIITDFMTERELAKSKKATEAGIVEEVSTLDDSDKSWWGKTKGVARSFNRYNIKQSRKVLNELGEGGREFGDRLDRMHDMQDKWMEKPGEIVYEYARLNKEERQNLEAIRNAMRFDKTEVSPMNEKVAKINLLVDEYYKSVADRSQVLGLEVKHTQTGETDLFKPRTNYEPRVSRFDVNDLIPKKKKLDDGTWEAKTGTTRQEIIDHWVKTGKARNAFEAAELMDEWIAKKTWKKDGNIEYAREMDLPEPLYENDPMKVLVKYSTRASKRLAQAELFGIKDELSSDLINKIMKDGYDYNFASQLWNEETGTLTPNQKQILHWVNATKSFMTVTKFTPFTAFRNSFQGFTGTAIRTNLKTAIKSQLVAFGEAAKRNAYESGVLTENLTREINKQISGGDKLTGMYLDGIGFSIGDKINRIISATGGEMFMRDMLKRIKEDSPFKRRAYREFEKVGLDVKEILKRGDFTQDELKSIRRSFAGKTQGEFHPSDLPVSWNMPLMKGITQWKSFGYNMTKLIRDAVYVEAKHGNFAPLATYLTVYLGAGEGVNLAIDYVRGAIKGDITGEDAKKKGLINRINTNEGIVGRIIDDLAGVGALSLMVDFARSFGYAKGKGAVGALVGPTLSEGLQTLEDIFLPTGEFIATGEGKEILKRTAKGAMNVGLRNIPVVSGPLRTFGGTRAINEALFPKNKHGGFAPVGKKIGKGFAPAGKRIK